MGKEIFDTNFVNTEPSFNETKIRSGLDFEYWCNANNISLNAQKQIERIRNSEPSRRVSSGKRSVSGTYPSRKMGVTIQFESHKNELPFIYELEKDSNVLEYYDQPEAIKLNYFNKGKNLGISHTPDFFVVYRDSAGWVECKTEEELLKLAVKSPNRYQLDEHNEWICPPGIEYAKQLGLSYELRSSKKINWILLRNIEFLKEFLSRNELRIAENILHVIKETVRKNPAITLESLIEKTSSLATLDDIFTLIVFEELYADLEEHAFTDGYEKIKVFINRETAEACSNIFDQNYPPRNGNFKSTAIKIKPNTEIVWDGRGWKILNVGELNITLIDGSEEPLLVQKKVFEALIKKGNILGTEVSDDKNDFDSRIADIIGRASIEDLKIANYRAAVIREIFNGETPENISARTLRGWKADYRNSQMKFGIGMGYLGLIPKTLTGNRESKIPSVSIRLMEKFINDDYETIKQKNRKSVFLLYEAECQHQGFYSASYPTFCGYVKKRDMKEQTKKRKGKRAAYEHEEFYWELSITTPRHGERPFHIAHIDHTELDIELVDSKTGRNLGRPWMTLLIDAFSRKVLAVYITFDPPSYRSNLMVMRECVRRHGRLPQILVVDGGKDFSSIYFESFLAMFEVTKKVRPPAEARFGSVIERVFGTTNTMFINNLQGNTQMTKNVRQMTKSVNPKNHAIWTLGKLYENLCEFLYEVYDQKEHSTLNQTPQEVFAQGMLKFGNRSHLMIPYTEEFKMMTLPSTKKGTAMIDNNRGVKINRIYYWCDEFRNPEVNRENVRVKYDPWDVGIAYAFVDNKWCRCISEYYPVLQGRSEKTIQIIAAEIKKQKKDSSARTEITAHKLAEHLQKTEADEKILKQLMADSELNNVHSLINYEYSEAVISEASVSEDDTTQADENESSRGDVVVPFPSQDKKPEDDSDKTFVLFDTF